MVRAVFALNRPYQNGKTIAEKFKARGEILQGIGVKPLPLGSPGLAMGFYPSTALGCGWGCSHAPSLLGRGLPRPIGDIIR